MVTSCFRIRPLLVAMVGHRLSESDRLRVEQHLAECQSCREEKGRWLLFETLRDHPPGVLGSAAKDRILSTLQTAPSASTPWTRRRPSLLRPRWGLALAAFAVFAGFALWKVSFSGQAVRPDKPANLASTSAPEPAWEVKDIVAAQKPGTLARAGIRVRYSVGTTLRMRSDFRRVDLMAGQLDVDVTPSTAGGFRVITPNFQVEVLGTHFIVGMGNVQTLRGKVRVLDASGQELVLLSAGETWSRPETTQASALPDPTTAKALPRPRERPIQVALTRPAPRTGSSVDRLLSEARAILGAGNPVLARARIEAVLDAEPTRRQRASAELLAADTLLVESRYEAALAGYRRTMALFNGFPEAETAAFAIAQIVSERGDPKDAQRALAQYLERFPQGRFEVEANRKLAKLARR